MEMILSFYPNDKISPNIYFLLNPGKVDHWEVRMKGQRQVLPLQITAGC